MKIGLAQINFVVGDFIGNAEKIRDAVRRVKTMDEDVRLVIFSELAICGYPPKDLLLRSGFVEACDAAILQLAVDLNNETPGVAVLVGHPSAKEVLDGRAINSASLLEEGKIVQTIGKQLLPNYDVFDERRYFQAAENVEPIRWNGLTLGVHICEDAWFGEDDTFYHTGPLQQDDPILAFSALGNERVDCLINLSASPFEVGKLKRRVEIFARHAIRCGTPFVFVNQIGGNDDLVFDGQSLVLNSEGKTVYVLDRFADDLQVIDLDSLPKPIEDLKVDDTGDLLDALILGLRDYATKCGFREAIFGLSGGIDSAVAAYLAARAFSPKHVHCLMMPSRYSSQHSVDDSVALADNLGIDAELISIEKIHHAYELTDVVKDDLKSDPAGLADQNLQARIRGALVMIRSNQHGWLPLATGNKSELAVGYCTLYGDMAGGFAVLSDLLKRDVYALARYINTEREKREMIPENIIEKAPSAELAPDQFDQDSLPPYPVLDAILEGLIEDELSVEELSKHHPRKTVEWVIGKLDRNEFKRRQMAPGIKLSPRAFGTGRRMPMAARLRLE